MSEETCDKSAEENLTPEMKEVIEFGKKIEELYKNDYTSQDIKQLEKDTFNDIKDVISIFILEYPFCIPVAKFNIKFVYSREHVAVTDGKSIYVNPIIWQAMRMKQKAGIIYHEWMHNALLYFIRMGNRDNRIFNFAQDFLINDMISKDMSKHMDMLPGCLLDSTYSNKSTEEIYEDLFEAVQQRKNDISFNKEELSLSIKNGWAGRKGKYVDRKEAIDILASEAVVEGLLDDLMNPAPDCDAEKMRHDILMGLELAKKCRKGSIPAHIERLIKELDRSILPWNKILDNYVKEIVHSGTIRSFAHPKKWSWKYGIALPGESGKKPPKVVVIYDTSGSVSDGDIGRFNGELQKILAFCKTCTVITSDAEVHEVVKIRSISDIIKAGKVRFLGRGGTDFRPALKEAVKHRADVVIYLTDGYGDFGSAIPGMKLIWVYNNNECAKPPFGKLIRM